MNLEIRGPSESNFLLRYPDQEGRTFGLVIKDFHLSMLRLKPTEKLRQKIPKILSGRINYPLLNIKLTEHILIRGSDTYEIGNLFQVSIIIIIIIIIIVIIILIIIVIIILIILVCCLRPSSFFHWFSTGNLLDDSSI